MHTSISGLGDYARPGPSGCRYCRAATCMRDRMDPAETVAEPNAGVHFGAAELFFGGDFASRGLQTRRPCKKGAGPAAYHDDVIDSPVW